MTNEEIHKARRTVIIGPPKAGKTTLGLALAAELGVSLLHTDDLIGKFEWSAASDHIATVWLAEPGPWIIEGVAAVRGLRKWLVANPSGKPCDLIIELPTPRIELSSRQAGMAKACLGIWTEIRESLRARGVAIETSCTVSRR
jgi:hypothetical protein